MTYYDAATCPECRRILGEELAVPLALSNSERDRLPKWGGDGPDPRFIPARGTTIELRSSFRQTIEGSVRCAIWQPHHRLIFSMKFGGGHTHLSVLDANSGRSRPALLCKCKAGLFAFDGPGAAEHIRQDREEFDKRARENAEREAREQAEREAKEQAKELSQSLWARLHDQGVATRVVFSLFFDDPLIVLDPDQAEALIERLTTGGRLSPLTPADAKTLIETLKLEAEALRQEVMLLRANLEDRETQLRDAARLLSRWVPVEK